MLQDKLQGARIVIVGGSSGIGFSVARLSLAAGAAKVTIGSSSQERVDIAIQKLKDESPAGEVEGYIVNAKHADQIQSFFDRIGHFDHLIWTGGGQLVQGFPNVDLVANRDLFDVPLWGPITAAQYVHQKKLINATGSITFTIGSVFRKPLPGWSLVAATAGSVEALTRSLAVDLQPTRVNVVGPGLVNTELWADYPKEARVKFFKDHGDKLLVKHVAEPEEIAEAYLFLMRCSFITGERVDVDGGMVLT